MSDETTNGPDADAIARDVSIEVLLSISCSVTHGELKEWADEGEDISEDDHIAKLIGTQIENSDDQLMNLLEEHGFIISKCTVNVSMPEKE